MLQASNLLLLSADRTITTQIAPFFAEHGVFVEQADNGARGLTHLLNRPFSAVVLDMALPVIDGVGMLHEIHMRTATPVVVMGGREEDCVRGMEAGAADWLLKPFEAPELLSRIRVQWRLRSKTTSSGMLRCGGITLSLKSHEAWLDGSALPLTNVEFAILKCLMRCAERVVSRDELAAVLYQREATPFERAIDVHISHVRRKLERSGAASIRTIRGCGYLLAASRGSKLDLDFEAAGCAIPAHHHAATGFNAALDNR